MRECKRVDLSGPAARVERVVIDDEPEGVSGCQLAPLPLAIPGDLCRFLSGFVNPRAMAHDRAASAGCKCRYGAKSNPFAAYRLPIWPFLMSDGVAGSVLRLAFDPDRLVAMPSQSLSSAV